MSNLSMCMCGSEAISRPFANSYVFTCSNTTCFMSEHEFAFEHWQALMGRGEPVAFADDVLVLMDHINDIWDELDYECVDPVRVAHWNKVSRAASAILEANTQAPAVGDAVLRDANRYRWLRHGDNDEGCVLLYGGGVNDGVAFLLRDEELDEYIDSAIKGEG